MKQLARSERMAIHVSNIANLVLFVAKVFASIESRSLAVIASTLDSLLDLLSGFILWFTSYAMRNPNQYHYPIGKKRMQPVVSHEIKLYALASRKVWRMIMFRRDFLNWICTCHSVSVIFFLCKDLPFFLDFRFLSVIILFYMQFFTSMFLL